LQFDIPVDIVISSKASNDSPSKIRPSFVSTIKNIVSKNPINGNNNNNNNNGNGSSGFDNSSGMDVEIDPNVLGSSLNGPLPPSSPAPSNKRPKRKMTDELREQAVCDSSLASFHVIDYNLPHVQPVRILLQNPLTTTNNNSSDLPSVDKSKDSDNINLRQGINSPPSPSHHIPTPIPISVPMPMLIHCPIQVLVRKRRVLVVDDSPICQKVMVRLLKGNDFDSDVASNGLVRGLRQ
jgi:hypothetical protein